MKRKSSLEKKAETAKQGDCPKRKPREGSLEDCPKRRALIEFLKEK